MKKNLTESHLNLKRWDRAILEAKKETEKRVASTTKRKAKKELA